MREPGHDLNHLLYLQQVALMEADVARNEAGRTTHLRVARAYEDEIFRRTDGRMRFGRPRAAIEPVDMPAVVPTLIVVAA